MSPGRVERTEERVFVAARDATLVGEVNTAIDRSTSPRFARPSCQEVTLKNRTTSAREGLAQRGEGFRGPAPTNANNGVETPSPGTSQAPPRPSQGTSLGFVSGLIVARGAQTFTVWAFSGVCLLRNRRLSQGERIIPIESADSRIGMFSGSPLLGSLAIQWSIQLDPLRRHGYFSNPF